MLHLLDCSDEAVVFMVFDKMIWYYLVQNLWGAPIAQLGEHLTLDRKVVV